MNIYLKQFLQRGAVFGGMGPIIAGFVYFVISLSLEDFALTGTEVFVGIVSTYILAFLQAGASVFNQVEHWSIGKSLFCHFALIYAAYIGCYLVNAWIPLDVMFIGIFTLIFTTVYFIIWLTVYFIIKATSKRLNDHIA